MDQAGSSSGAGPQKLLNEPQSPVVGAFLKALEDVTKESCEAALKALKGAFLFPDLILSIKYCLRRQSLSPRQDERRGKKRMANSSVTLRDPGDETD
jgi:hypothetical protein